MSFEWANLLVRDSSSGGISTTTTVLLVVLLVLAVLALLLIGGLFFLRRRRLARQQDILPVYDEKRASTSSTVSSHRRVMTRPSEVVHVRQEQQTLMENSDSPPASPLPEIRITLPEEVDAAGKRLSGRVVVVHVGDMGVALEPVETLPAYQQHEGERFQSLDLDRIGGLVEKQKA